MLCGTSKLTPTVVSGHSSPILSLLCATAVERGVVGGTLRNSAMAQPPTSAGVQFAHPLCASLTCATPACCLLLWLWRASSPAHTPSRHPTPRKNSRSSRTSSSSRLRAAQTPDTAATAMSQQNPQQRFAAASAAADVKQLSALPFPRVQPLIGCEKGSFAQDTITTRLPAIMDTVLADLAIQVCFGVVR